MRLAEWQNQRLVGGSRQTKMKLMRFSQQQKLEGDRRRLQRPSPPRSLNSSSQCDRPELELAQSQLQLKPQLRRLRKSLLQLGRRSHSKTFRKATRRINL